MNINLIEIERKFNLGNYEMVSVKIGFTFPSETEPNMAVNDVKKHIGHDLESLKDASLNKS